MIPDPLAEQCARALYDLCPDTDMFGEKRPYAGLIDQVKDYYREEVAAVLAIARPAIVEECAQICEETALESEMVNDPDSMPPYLGGRSCAARIRAFSATLKESDRHA